MKLNNTELEEKLSELYRTNVIVNYVIQSGRKQGMNNLTILAHTVIALASHNNELQDQLLKIEMERPVSRSIIL